jgi:hypothetical protein
MGGCFVNAYGGGRGVSAAGARRRRRRARGRRRRCCGRAFPSKPTRSSARKRDSSRASRGLHWRRGARVAAPLRLMAPPERRPGSGARHEGRAPRRARRKITHMVLCKAHPASVIRALRSGSGSPRVHTGHTSQQPTRRRAPCFRICHDSIGDRVSHMWHGTEEDKHQGSECYQGTAG